MKLISQIKRFFRQVRGFFPQSLPVGLTAFETFAKELEDTYTLPTQDRDSVRFTLTTVIMHLGPSESHKSKWYFVRRMKAAAAKQIAGAVFQDIKTRHQEAVKVEATTPKAVAPDAPAQG